LISAALKRGSIVTDTITKSGAKDDVKVERPRLHKVILINDDFTPREFVVIVLRTEFRVSIEQAQRIMMTAHKRGACIVAVYTKDVAEAKATNATDCRAEERLSPVVHDRAGRIDRQSWKAGNCGVVVAQVALAECIASVAAAVVRTTRREQGASRRSTALAETIEHSLAARCIVGAQLHMRQ
jgi:ATP-dependent Clp protease adaptor protein ClpS